MSSYAILQPQTEAGRIRAIVVNGRVRAPILPNVPTAAEAGFPALEVEGLEGLFGPKGMSNALREKIATEVVAATKDPAVSARLRTTAQVANPGSPDEFAASIDQQRTQIAMIAQELGIKPKQ
jgi:tripartite-type tricarboxylate transporter receptor subunit TctC